jgi:hypothetical protein
MIASKVCCEADARLIRFDLGLRDRDPHHRYTLRAIGHCACERRIDCGLDTRAYYIWVAIDFGRAAKG